MRRFPLLLLMLFLSPALGAQESYTQNATAPQAAKVTTARLDRNANTCLSLGLASDCTQAAACVAVGLASNCSANAARVAGVRIDDTNQSWSETILYTEIKKRDETDEQADVAASRAAWFAASQAQRDSACSAIGRPAGCKLVR